MVIIGSDHTGIDLKKKIIEFLKEENIGYTDVTDFASQEGDDYPDVAYLICSEVLKRNDNLGIAICGTGIGISIACNKVAGIRAALCTNMYMAEMSRKDNNANVICLGSRTEYSQNSEDIQRIVDVFLNTFFEGGRHERRVEKIKALEDIRTEGGYRYDS